MSTTAAAGKDTEEDQHTDPETEDDSEHDTSTESTDDEQHAGDGAAKKKKKKKKKKKASVAAAGAASGNSNEQAGGSEKLTAAEKQEAERRFQKAMDSAKQGEDMWVLLASANLHDAKIKKLFEALRTNSSITSVNLSANQIGDEGVHALVDVLQQGGCSELISLDLRGNTLSADAQALLADLGKRRKQLDIATGPLPPPESEASSSSSSGSSGPGHGRGKGGRGGRGGAAGGRGAAGAGQQQQLRQQQQQQELSEQSIQDLVRTSPMFRRYFQTGDEDDAEGSSGEEEAEQTEQLPPPEEVWAQVDELLPKGQDSIPQLSAALATISRAMDTEMSSMPAHEEEAGLADFQPHFKAVIQHMPQLQQVLQLQAAPKVHQSSSSTPQPAVGSHRVWACGILHMLLLHNNPVIDRAVAEAAVLPVVLAMALQHGHCSAVQCRAVEMLRSSLRSSVQDLWKGLFTAGYGQQLQRPGSSNLLPPLHVALVQIAEDVLQQPMGERPCGTGFAIEVANTLLQATDLGPDPSNPEQLCPALVTVLEACAAWQSSIASGGAIHSLLKEQDGQLCGPPPPRPAPSIDSMDDDSLDPLGGLMMNGQLVALLNHMREVS